MRRLAGRAAAALSAVALSLGASVSTAAAAGGTVTIDNTGCNGHTYCYKPSSLSITDGSRVTWNDDSGAPHDVTRCTPAACGGLGGGNGSDNSFTSLSIGPGGSANHTFHGTGTYNYYCTIHGFNVMHGSITVAAPK